MKDSQIKQVACGKYFSIILKSDGEALMSGPVIQPIYGVTNPCLLPIATQIEKVFAAPHSAFFLNRQGQLLGDGLSLNTTFM